MSPDRVAINDLFVITGTNFIPEGESPQTFVIFQGLAPIPVQPDSGGQISLFVPEEAKSGTVQVKTTCVVEGVAYEMISNAPKILVIWKEYDLRQIIEYFNNYFGDGNYNRNFGVGEIMATGANENVFLRINGGTVGYTIETFVTIKGDGTWSWQYLGNFWPSQSLIWDEAADPITQSPALLLSSANYMTIQAPGFPPASFPKATCPSGQSCYYDWRPSDICYDSEGNLYVLGNYQGNYYDVNDDICCIWKFSRGEQIILNPNSPSSLIPGGISGYMNNFSVGGNGDLAAEIWQGYNYSILTLSENAGFQIIVPPFSHPYCEGSWRFAVDCRGTIYTTNEEYNYSECGGPFVFTIPDNQPLFSIPNGICGLHHPAVDGYGNIYLWGNRRCLYEEPDYPIIRRIAPDELPEGYYEGFSCCFLEDLRTGQETPPPGVQPLTCSNCTVTPLTALTGDAEAFDKCAHGTGPADCSLWHPEHLTDTAQKLATCIQGIPNSPNRIGWDVQSNSAWRPDAYQDHLWEIWHKLDQINHLPTDIQSACQRLRTVLERERQIHDLPLPPNGGVSRHENSHHCDQNGKANTAYALDMTITFPPGVDVDFVVCTECHGHRPFLNSGETWHFEPYSGQCQNNIMRQGGVYDKSN